MTDDTAAKYILDNTNVFSNIHPNIITGLGFLCTLMLSSALRNKRNNMIALLLAGRWLADILDGNIARKYKKTSKLGNKLDTASDLLFALVAGYLIFKKYYWSIVLYMVLAIIWIYVLTMKYDMFNTHEKLKSGKNNDVDKFMKFLTDNSWITYIAVLMFLTR